MGTTRTPIRPQRKFRISPAAVKAFRRMEAAHDWGDQWWSAHSELHDELHLPPWHWPVFEYPDAECPYPPGCYAAEYWQRNRDEHPERFELYRALKEAAEGAS
jgi:hypothetical protein